VPDDHALAVGGRGGGAVGIGFVGRHNLVERDGLGPQEFAVDPVELPTCTSDQVIAWDGSAWTCKDVVDVHGVADGGIVDVVRPAPEAVQNEPSP